MAPETDIDTIDETADESSTERRPGAPTPQQVKWLARGLEQPGGKLPLFDDQGQRVSERTVKSCLRNGWAEPWFANPIKPDWQICKLTETGRSLLYGMPAGDDDAGATVHHLHS